MPDFTIGEAARILGVSQRTLRHWDSIGVLQPEWRTMSDYRLYTDSDIQRGVDILIYRGIGVPLRDIPAILDAAPADAITRLREQRTQLLQQRTRVDAMITAVDNLLDAHLNKEHTMEEKWTQFGTDWARYQDEAHAKWGNTPEWSQAASAWESLDPAQVTAQFRAFAASLGDAASRNIVPTSDEARTLVNEHRDLIAQFFDVSRDRQLIIARMYVDDPRFNESLNGHAAYLLSLVEATAQNEGVDIDNPRW